jgi:membrane protein implicated in regulation of membrane protease activity
VALLIGGTLAILFVPFPWWIPIVVALAALELVEFRIWRWAVRERPRSGAEALVGRTGELADGDRVRIHGTSYPARVLEGRPGDRVRVEAVEGMTLVVRALSEGPTGDVRPPP